MAGLNALSGSSAVTPATGPTAPSPATPVATPRVGQDSLALTRCNPNATEAPFSKSAASKHFFQGAWNEGRDMLHSLWQHPFATVGIIAVGTGALAAAPLIGVSSAVAGEALAVAFALYGGYRIAHGFFQATHLASPRAAEAAFEESGRGAFDVATAFAPTAVEEGLAFIKHARAGSAAAQGVAVVESTSAVETALTSGSAVAQSDRCAATVKVAAAPRGALKDALARAALLADDFLGWLSQLFKSPSSDKDAKKKPGTAS